jgi:hypothetical protein
MRRLRDGLRATEWYQSEQEKEQGVPPRTDPYAWLAFERDVPLEPGQDGTRSSAGGKRVLPPLSELDLSDVRTLSALRAGGHLQPDRLHMVAAFRSHDLYAGYSSNLAALCLWLVEESERLKAEPGTLTVTSYSAHVYARDYAAALDVVKANPAPMVQWDQRSSWRIRTKPGPEVEGLRCGAKVDEDHRTFSILCGRPAVGIHPTALTPCCDDHRLKDVGPWVAHPDREGAWCRLWGEAPAEPSTRNPLGKPCAEVIPDVIPGWFRWSAHDLFTAARNMESSLEEVKADADRRIAEWSILLPLPRAPVLVAEALTPGEEGGDEILAAFEAPNPGALRLAIDRSGLTTGVGAALWLGSEIERVWAAATKEAR